MADDIERTEPDGFAAVDDDDECVEINDLPVVAWVIPATVQLTPSNVAEQPKTWPASGIAEVASLGDPVAMLSSSLRLKREQHRSRITEGLMLLFLFGVAALLLLVGLHRITVDESLRVANAFVTPIIALLGACVGHYFARKPGGS